MEAYRQLVSELKTELHDLESLYHERNQMQSEKTRLQDQRTNTADLMFDARNDSSQITKHAKALELIDSKLSVVEAQLGGLAKHVESQESALHERVPRACYTFTRLQLAFRHAIQLRARKQLSELIGEGYRIQFQQEIDRLTQVMTCVLEASEIQIPPGGHWLLQRQLTPETRQETMQFVVQTGHDLIDSAEELLVELDKLMSLKETLTIPEFLLGELPEPEPEKVTVPQFSDEGWQSQTEHEYVLTLCKQAGKSLENLSDDDKWVLQMSLQNFRSQAQMQMAMGQTS